MRIAARLYLTYMLLEARSGLRALLTDGEPRRYAATDFARRAAERAWWERIARNAGDDIEERFVAGDFAAIRPQIDLFLGLLEAWRRAVEQNGGRFHLLLPPRPEEAQLRALLPTDLSVVDLSAELARLLPGYSYEQIRFRNDDHWNELGNMYAAIVLARRLAPAYGLRPPSDAALGPLLQRYYAAFDGWRPPTLPGEQRLVTAPAERTTLWQHYRQLELERGLPSM